MTKMTHPWWTYLLRLISITNTPSHRETETLRGCRLNFGSKLTQSLFLMRSQTFFSSSLLSLRDERDSCKCQQRKRPSKRGRPRARGEEIVMASTLQLPLTPQGRVDSGSFQRSVKIHMGQASRRGPAARKVFREKGISMATFRTKWRRGKGRALTF